MLFFKKKPYITKIHHEDWSLEEHPKFEISRKVHKQGKSPVVTIDSPCKTSGFDVQRNGTVIVKRGLGFDRGTPFSVTVTIS